MTWIWVPSHLVAAWQARLIEQFGGATGVRDAGLLDGALARPRNLAADEPDAPIERLAALYGTGIAKAHALVDGNKRIGFAVMVSFLRAHGRSLDATEAEAAATMQAVAAGTMDQAALEQWIRDH